MWILFILLMNVNHIHQLWGLESNKISNINYIRKGFWKGIWIYRNCDTLVCFCPWILSVKIVQMIFQTYVWKFPHAKSFHAHKTLKIQLSNNVLKFECPFCLSNVHHSFPKFERRFIFMIKIAKGVEINKKTYLLHISTHLVQTCFWPSKLQNLMMYF
jgi:hypothetical protein